MTRPCWSADPLDMLVTATAPLWNQGIQSFLPSLCILFYRDPPSSPSEGPGCSAGGLPLQS